MDIVIDFNIKICIPQSNSSGKINLGLCRQFKVTFNMVLLAIETTYFSVRYILKSK